MERRIMKRSVSDYRINKDDLKQKAEDLLDEMFSEVPSWIQDEVTVIIEIIDNNKYETK